MKKGKKRGLTMGNKTVHKNLLLEPVIYHGEKWFSKPTDVSPNMPYEGELGWLMKKDNKFYVMPPNMQECFKCGAQFVSQEKLTYCRSCTRNSTFIQITPPINPDLWQLPEWKDLEGFDMKETFDKTLELIKKVIVFPSDIHYKIYTLWIFSTWKAECFDAVGFLIFIGPPNSGKSKALDIIHELGYRAPKASGITAAAIPRLTNNYGITLLIDEAHTKLNPHSERGAELLDFIKDSYRKGSVYIVSDKNDDNKIIVRKNFGFKAIAGEKSFNPALLSRAIVFWMENAEPEIAKLEYVSDKLNEIRTVLLNYRYKIPCPPDLGNNFELKGRNREVFESIIRTGRQIGVDVSDIIEYARGLKEEEMEELKNSIEYEILTVIRNGSIVPYSNEEIDGVFTDTILSKIGWNSENSDELRKNRQRLGYIWKNLGIKTRRTTMGRFIPFDINEERLKQLYKRYGMEGYG